MDEIRAHGAADTSNGQTRTSRPAFHEISFDLAGSRVRLPHDMEIDLGGIAKAWIVEKAAQLLHKYTEVCAVSAGGDILFIGRPLDGSDWDVYLEDPRNTIETLAQFHISQGAVATSSVMKRSWMQGEKIRHHLIDPRTGEPAETDWLSVTVIAPDILTAEVYAKAILIAGEAGLSNLRQIKPDIAFIAVDPDGNLFGSPNSKDYLYEFTHDALLSHAIAG
jgi:thiamine biosynthesis lipoprotein